MVERGESSVGLGQIDAMHVGIQDYGSSLLGDALQHPAKRGLERQWMHGNAADRAGSREIVHVMGYNWAIVTRMALCCLMSARVHNVEE